MERALTDSSFSRLLLHKSALEPQTRNQTRLSGAIQTHLNKPLVPRSDDTLEHNSLTKSSSCFNARSITSLIEFNDWRVKKILTERLKVNVEVLKTHIVQGERCQRHPRTLSSWQVSSEEGFLRA